MAQFVWINGAFGVGKTHTAYEIYERMPSQKAFVYDPENAGYYLRRNLPTVLHRSDFQDHSEWRRINNLMLRRLSAEYDGTVLIPMTVIDPAYWQELTEGVTIDYHILLLTSRETLQKRMRHRAEGANSFAAQMAERCLNAFETDFGRTVPNISRLNTDAMSISEVADAIASIADLQLVPPCGKIASTLRHLHITIKHIR